MLSQLLRRNVKRFRGGLVVKAHRLVYHSTLGLRVIKKKRSVQGFGGGGALERGVCQVPASAGEQAGNNLKQFILLH